jgi:hypothetical protein
MAAHGGIRWSRPIALLLVLASCGIALSACEYQDASPAPGDPSAAASPSTPPTVPMASRGPIDTPAAFSPPARPPVPEDDPALARVRVRNQAQLEKRLGLPPDGLVLGGSGGLGNGGLQASATEIPRGSYTVTAECVGMLKASLTVSQPGLRGGTTHEVAFNCRTTARAKLDLAAGPVSLRITPSTATDPGHTAIAGFWMVPAA